MPPSGLHPSFLALTTLRHARSCLQTSQLRSTSASATSNDLVDAAVAAILPSRWLSDLKRRIGYCINFGLSHEQTVEAGAISKILTQDWRELVAGSEGFLTGRGRAGFEGREVVWGEMVSYTWEPYTTGWRLEWEKSYQDQLTWGVCMSRTLW